MPNYRVKKGLQDGSKIPIEEWTTDIMCSHYFKKFKSTYKIDTRRPMGQMKIHINQKTISKLFRMEGRSIDVHPNKLYQEFMDWNIERKTVKNMRIWYLSKDEIMADFLDERAVRIMNEKLGDMDDFRQAEESRIKKAKEFFGDGK